MSVQTLIFHYATTNQELDKDSEMVSEVIHQGQVVGSTSIGRRHGKQYRDGTHNDVVVHLRRAVPVRSLSTLRIRVRMGAEGNNKWRFKLSLRATGANVDIRSPEKGETELNSRGSSWESAEYSWD